MKMTTCPSIVAEVRDVLFPVTVLVKLMVLDRSKQFEPSTWSALVTAAPVWPILPANVSGGFPGTVDAALNCQLPNVGGAVVGRDDDIYAAIIIDVTNGEAATEPELLEDGAGLRGDIHEFLTGVSRQ